MSAVLAWLCPLRMTQFHQTISDRARDGSGRWFLTSEQFKQWESDDERLLWCSGIRKPNLTIMRPEDELRIELAGAGKTVLAYGKVSVAILLNPG